MNKKLENITERLKSEFNPEWFSNSTGYGIRLIFAEGLIVEELNSVNTVGEVLGGERLSNFVFRIFQQYGPMVFFFVIFLVGNSEGVFSFLGHSFISPWMSLLVLPGLWLVAMALSIDLLFKLVFFFDVIYAVANILVYTISLGILFGGDSRIVCVIASAPVLLLASLNDALPIAFRKRAMYLLFIPYLCWLGFCYIGLLFKWFPVEDHIFDMGGVHMSALSLASASIINLFSFGIRNIFTVGQSLLSSALISDLL
jgi:hypothetical protein